MEENKEIIEKEVTEIEAEVAETEVVEEPPEEKVVLVENEVKFNYRTMKYLNMYIIKHKKKTFLIYVIFSILTVGVAVYSFIDSYLNSDKPDFIFPVLFVLFAVYMMYQGLTIEKALDKQLDKFFAGKETTIQITEMNDECMYVSRGTKDEMGEAVKVDWASISEIHEIPDYYYLFMGNNPIVIDKRPQANTKGTVEDLKAIIKEKSLSRKFVRVDKEILKTPIKDDEETQVFEQIEDLESSEETKEE